MAIEPITVEAEDDLWKFTPSPTVSAMLHILAHEPLIEFDPTTYPSVTILDQAHDRARFNLSLTGSAEQRAVVARKLHEVADAIAAWTS